MLSRFNCVPLFGPYGPQPARLLCPWDSPGKNTGIGCHFLLQGIFPTQGLMSLMSPALAGGFSTIGATWECPVSWTRGLAKVKSEMLVAQLCRTLWDPMDCSLPDSSIHGILQARILEWVAISFLHGIFPTHGPNENQWPKVAQVHLTEFSIILPS